MNTLHHPADTVPLQAGSCDGPPGQTGGQSVVQYTTVNMTSEPPKDHIIWSLCCFMYANPCCLGLAALIFSIKARDRKMAGDMQGATSYGATARQLNIAATILASIIVLIFLITIIAVSVWATNIVSTSTYGHGYGYGSRG